jgi:hypothetical protein
MGRRSDNAYLTELIEALVLASAASMLLTLWACQAVAAIRSR